MSNDQRRDLKKSSTGMVKKTISKSSKRTWAILRLHYSQEPAWFIATFSDVISYIYIYIYICLFQLRTGGKRLKESGQYPKKFASKIARAQKPGCISIEWKHLRLGAPSWQCHMVPLTSCPVVSLHSTISGWCGQPLEEIVASDADHEANRVWY